MSRTLRYRDEVIAVESVAGDIHCIIIQGMAQKCISTFSTIRPCVPWAGKFRGHTVMSTVMSTVMGTVMGTVMSTVMSAVMSTVMSTLVLI